MNYLKQSTAVDIALGPFVDSTDGVTAETALTLSQADIRLKKNGGAWAQKSQASSATHEENGWYEVSLDTTDTNTLGILVVAVNESGALPVWREFTVMSANVYDSLIGSTDNLQVDAIQLSGTAQTARDIGASVLLAANALTAAVLATDAVTEIQSGLATSAEITALNDLDAAGIRTAVGLASANLDTQLAALPTAATIADAVLDESVHDHLSGPTSLATYLEEILIDTEVIPQLGVIIDDLVELDVSVYRFTANALEQAPSGGGSLTLANFFDTDSGETAGTAVSGSVVGEIVASIAGGGIPGSVEVTDIVIDDGTDPIEGAAVWITTDSAGTNTVWAGTTNASGSPKSPSNVNPFLDPGTYYLWVQLGGYTFSNPTTKVIS